jgi:hypothetical protein
MSLGGISLFPNILSDDSEKDTPEFGYNFMQAAYTNWDTGYNGETRYGRQTRFDYNRAFAMGRQPMQEYKDILDLDGEDSVIQLIYEPLPIAIPFLMRMDDRDMQRIEKISCNAIDPFTTEKKKKAKDNAKFKLKEKPNILALQQQSGTQIEDFKENDPQTEEEVEVEFGYNYKEREEVIMQELINIVFYDNDMSGVIKGRILDDLRCCGYSGTKVYIDANGRIKIRFIQPENLVTSYCRFNDFRDWEYNGEVFCETIANIRLKYPGKISEQKLFNLASTNCGKYGNPADFGYGWDYAYTTALARPYDSFRVELIELEVKTLYNLKYKTGVDRFGKATLDPIKKAKSADNLLQSNAYEVTYTGVMVANAGTGDDEDDKPWNYVLEWGLSKNMVKPKDNLQEVVSSYVVYMYGNHKMVNKPLVETMIPSIKKMQLIDLKQQAIIAAAMPDGYDVDISTMSDVDIGNGSGVLSPFEIYKIKKQTGIGFYKRLDDGGMGQDRREPITPNNVPFSGKLEQLRGEWNAEFDTLMKITGDNNLNAGIVTNQAVSQEVVKQAKQTGESSSNYIYNSYLNILQRTAKLVQLRGWDILVFGKKENRFYDGYRRALGNDKVEYLRVEGSDDFDKTTFDIQLTAIVDDQAQMFLEQNLATALSQKEITVADAMEVRKRAEIDVDYASYMLGARINRRKREAAETAKQNSLDNTQAAEAAAQAKGLQDRQTIQFKHDLLMQEEDKKAEIQKELEILKSVGIIKAEIAKSLMAQPGATWKDLPPIIMDGMGIVDQSEKQLMVHAIHVEQEQDAADAQAQAQQAQQQQMQQQQQQGQGQPQQQMPPNQQQAA